MVTLKNLLPIMDDFLIGDDTTHKILKPETTSLDNIINARVTSITAKSDTPVIWVNLSGSEGDVYEI